MSAHAPRPRTTTSLAIETVLWAGLWGFNLYEMLTRLRSMSFPMAASTVMIFFIVPAEMWRTWSGRRKETA